MFEFIQSLKKAELHIHIEGSLEPETVFHLAKRNNIPLSYQNKDELAQAYNFSHLQSFLDLYYQGMQVLRTEDDFYALMLAYLYQAHLNQITHAEIFFDPQGHTQRGIGFEIFMPGFKRAIDEAMQLYGIKASLILCILRHLPEDQAQATLAQAMNYRELLIGIGLDSSELGFPPRLFKNVFNQARAAGLQLVAHAGEEGPAAYIWEALDILGVARIDHGNAAITDKALIARIVADKIPLTMCPLSNLRLHNIDDLAKHPLRPLMEAGVKVTINSDDPAYFGGYLNANYYALATNLGLSRTELAQLAANSLDACFVN